MSYFEEGLRVVSQSKDDQRKKHYKLEFCQEYVLEKQTNVSFGIGLYKSKSVVDYVHNDV